MKGKLTIILAVMAAFAALIFGINRLSTQMHPWGNWVLGGAVLIGLAIWGAWWWQSEEDE